MNRHEREVRSTERIFEILDQSKICRLAMHDENGEIYILPMNFGYEVFPDDGLRLWFHGAPRGKKLSLLKQNPKVGFEMDCNVQIIESASLCSYSYTYMSLVGKGKAVLVDDDDYPQKNKALKFVLAHQANVHGVDLPEAKVRGVGVFYVDVEELSGKERM